MYTTDSHGSINVPVLAGVCAHAICVRAAWGGHPHLGQEDAVGVLVLACQRVPGKKIEQLASKVDNFLVPLHVAWSAKDEVNVAQSASQAELHFAEPRQRYPRRSPTSTIAISTLPPLHDTHIYINTHTTMCATHRVHIKRVYASQKKRNQ